MLDKIKNTIRNNIWGWSFLITFASMGLLAWRYEKEDLEKVLPVWVFGGLLFFYGISIQKQVTWKNAIIVGAKVFLWIFGVIFFVTDLGEKAFRLFVISTLVFTVIACLLNLIIKRKSQVEDKKSEQKLVVNKNACEFNPKVWNWSAFITFLLVAGLALIVEVVSVRSWFSVLFLGPLLVYDLCCAIFSGCFSFWSEKINQPSLLEKAVVLGGSASLVIYGSMFIAFELFLRLGGAKDLVPVVFLCVVAFTLIYTGLVCSMAKIAEIFKVKAPKNKKKKSV